VDAEAESSHNFRLLSPTAIPGPLLIRLSLWRVWPGWLHLSGFRLGCSSLPWAPRRVLAPPTSSPPPAHLQLQLRLLRTPSGRCHLGATLYAPLRSFPFCHFIFVIGLIQFRRPFPRSHGKPWLSRKLLITHPPIYRFFVSIPPVDLTVADGASHPPLGTALIEIKPR
jgi:hypothetical protein